MPEHKFPKTIFVEREEDESGEVDLFAYEVIENASVVGKEITVGVYELVRTATIKTTVQHIISED